MFKGSKKLLKTFGSSRKVCKVPPFKLETSLREGSLSVQHTRLFSSHLLEIKQIPIAIYSPKRFFRTSSPNNGLPTLALILKLVKYSAICAALFANRWWDKLPPGKRKELALRARRHRNLLWGLFGVINVGAFIYCYTNVQENPLTKRKRFVAFNDDQINEMAKQELQQLLEEHKHKILPAGTVQPIYRRVYGVAQRLLDANSDLSQIHSKEWTIMVVKDDHIVDAIVLPCGSIIVFSGLLKICATDDQLAILLGHEMAHAVLAHRSEEISFYLLVDLFSVMPLAAFYALISWLAIVYPHLLLEIFVDWINNHILESEADEVGLVLAAKACFDVREGPVIWAKLDLLKEESTVGLSHVKAAERICNWEKTHHDSVKRYVHVVKLVPDAIKTREACNCPDLPSVDPRYQIEMIGREIMIYHNSPKNIIRYI